MVGYNKYIVDNSAEIHSIKSKIIAVLPSVSDDSRTFTVVDSGGSTTIVFTVKQVQMYLKKNAYS